MGLPWWLSGKELTCPCRRRGFDPRLWEDPTCSGATEPMGHSYKVSIPQLRKPTRPRARNPQQPKPSRWACCNYRVAPTRHNYRKIWTTKTQHSQKQINKKITGWVAACALCWSHPTWSSVSGLSQHPHWHHQQHHNPWIKSVNVPIVLWYSAKQARKR